MGHLLATYGHVTATYGHVTATLRPRYGHVRPRYGHVAAGGRNVAVGGQPVATSGQQVAHQWPLVGYLLVDLKPQTLCEDRLMANGFERNLSLTCTMTPHRASIDAEDGA